jgi:hypothetical protein
MTRDNFLFLAFLFLFLIAATSAVAQTPISDDMRAQFKSNCLRGAEAEGTLTPEHREQFCACSAEKMQSAMTLEDAQAMTGNDQAARDAINKTILEVHAPCMDVAIYDLIHKKCEKDVGTPSVCACLAEKMSVFTAEKSQEMLKTLLEQNPNMMDPMAAVVDSPEFQQEQQRIALSCAIQ